MQNGQQSWDHITEEMLKGRYRLHWWYRLKFKLIYWGCLLVRIPNDLRDVAGYNPMAKWYYRHIAKPSYEELVSLRQKGYY